MGLTWYVSLGCKTGDKWGSLMSSASIEQASREQFWPAQGGVATLSRGIDWIWRNHRSAIVLTAEVFLAAAAFSFATVILSGSPSDLLTVRLLAGLGLLLIFRLVGLTSVRLYSRSLRSASIPDLISIVAVA